VRIITINRRGFGDIERFAFGYAFDNVEQDNIAKLFLGYGRACRRSCRNRSLRVFCGPWEYLLEIAAGRRVNSSPPV